ncbi:conserved protein of unknown function (plasmid) [Rhodovastum atsumiense]|uniref:Uncharacterized protein n=1 Tax=Rhodovastum atsumiense TaxID=504468 RepID=A0A5M6IJS5_9PROT|nr:hypothetical protein [Rhodovastum atsumiense]KAA5608432.1 hypothetical protein F1189_29130 [Rhodovastum atsumiense]CAH2605717.1 conserved protein of unknown function [Rhodovastum atsumiense]
MVVPSFAHDLTVTGRVHACAVTQDALCVLTDEGEGVRVAYEDGPKASRDPRTMRLAALEEQRRQEAQRRAEGRARREAEEAATLAEVQQMQRELDAQAPILNAPCQRLELFTPVKLMIEDMDDPRVSRYHVYKLYKAPSYRSTLTGGAIAALKDTVIDPTVQFGQSTGQSTTALEQERLICRVTVISNHGEQLFAFAPKAFEEETFVIGHFTGH